VDAYLDLKNLDKFTKQMKANIEKHYAKVGVLSAKNNRADSESGFGNAKLAAVHEYGSRDGRIPERSIFRLTADKRSEEMSAFIDSKQTQILKDVTRGKIKDVYKMLGAKWMSFLFECFETEGFGTWPEIADSTYWMKLERFEEMYPNSKKQFNPKILQDTGQLANSITYEVV